MNWSTIQKLPTIDEDLFYRLLDGAGTVLIEIAKVERYFVPVVTHLAAGERQRIPCGAIVRGGRDMLAAESVHDALSLLDDLAGNCKSMKINLVIEDDVWDDRHV